MGLHFELSDPAFLADPYPTYSALRSAGPLWRHPEGTWFVSRYAEVTEVLKSPDRFSSRAMILPGQHGDEAGSLIGQDPPTHTRQRNIVNRGFTPRRIALLEDRIRARVEGLFEGFAAKPEFDLIEALAAPLPVMVIAELLGLDASRHDDFKRWSDKMVVTSTASDSATTVEAAVEEMFAYLAQVIDERRRAPAGDLISALVHAEEEDGALSAVQVLHFTQLLLAAGSETTTNLLGNAVLALLEHPDQHARVRNDLGLLPGLIEETLRWDSPVQLVMRRANGPLEFCGQKLEHDSNVMVLLGSANRDEERFSRAERFDFQRDAQGHVAFGLGNHFCLGSALARLQARIALETLFTKLPGLALASSDPVARHGSFLVRGPRELMLRVASA